MLNELLIKDLSDQVSTNQVDIQNLKIANTYSTDEIIVGYWKDGRAIYRVFLNATTPNTINNWKEIYIGHNIDFIVDYGGKFSGTTTSFALPLNTGDRDFWFAVNSNHNIQMCVDASNDTNKSIDLWFDYVKLA